MSIRRFYLPRFIDTIVAFWKAEVPTMPAHEVAFAFVGETGLADFGTDCLWDEADTVGDSPLEWLQHGQTLFAQFTRQIDGSYEGVDGTKWVEPEDDEDEEYLHELSGSELGSYGFLISLTGDRLSVQTAVLREISGECRVTPVKHAGPFEDAMVGFIESMLQKKEEK